MSKPRKILLAILTAWPPVYLVIFVVTVIGMLMAAASGAPGTPADGPPAWLLGLFVVHAGTMLLMLALTIFYGVHAYRSERVPETRRVLWVVLNILGSFIAQLIYWYLFIWRDPEPRETVLPTRAM